MFIAKGSSRTVFCFPLVGIVVKLPIMKQRQVGVAANKAEAYFWHKTHHALLAPVLFSFLGYVVVMPYYPNKVRKGVEFNGRVTREVLDWMMKQRSFFQITQEIFGVPINRFFDNGHDAQDRNFRLLSSGKPIMIDYGIVSSEGRQRFEEFLEKHANRLVAEYAE